MARVTFRSVKPRTRGQQLALELRTYRMFFNNTVDPETREAWRLKMEAVMLDLERWARRQSS